MRAFPNTVSVSSSTETPLVAGEEKVVLITPPISTQGESDRVVVDGSLQVTVGAGATSYLLRVRRGGVTGTVLLATPTVTVSASTTVNAPFNAEDFPGEAAGLLYVVTLTVAGGAGTMKVINANLSY